MISKLALTVTISFLLSILTGYIILPILKNLKIEQRLNRYLEKTHSLKKNTPTMGGLIFIIPTLITIILMIMYKKIYMNYSLLIVLITFIGYFIIGFIDDYLIIKRNNNKGLTPNKKFLLQLVISVIFFYFFMLSKNEPLLWIHTLNLRIDISWLYGLFILFILTASSNAVNLTDGLDGLASGLSVIAISTFGIICMHTGWLDGYQSLTYFCFALVGSILGFMLYNLHPAKVFMGDTGSLALGGTLGALAILTRRELLLIVIGIVFIIETLSCIIQIVYFHFTKKRIFPMTPIHHSFEKMGWKETNIVKLFWIIGLIASLLSLGLGDVI